MLFGRIFLTSSDEMERLILFIFTFSVFFVYSEAACSTDTGNGKYFQCTYLLESINKYCIFDTESVAVILI